MVAASGDCDRSSGECNGHLTNQAGRQLVVDRNSQYTQLKEALLTGYDMNTAPVNCTVKLQVSIQQFSEISTPLQQVKMSAWWRHYWKDPRLSWNATAWGGIDFVTFKGTGEMRQIWVPDNVVHEAMEARNIIEESDISVYASGDIFVSFPMIHTIHCPMILDEFPFDTQNCKLTVSSWTNHGFIMDITARDDSKPVDVSYYRQSNEFMLLSVDAVRKVHKYNCCPEPWPELSLNLVLKRQPLMYSCGVIIPLILMTLVGFTAFLLNPSTGERIGLGITVMLTTAAIYIVANEALPAIGTYTVVSQVYLLSLSLSSITLLASIIVVSLHEVRNSEGLASEGALLNMFVRADEDGSGDLSKEELFTALANVGLPQSTMDRIMAYASKSTGETLSFGDWYDIVAKFNVPDGMASCHCLLYQVMLAPFMCLERRLRKQIMVRRAIMAKRLSKVLVEEVSQEHQKSKQCQVNEDVLVEEVSRRDLTSNLPCLLGSPSAISQKEASASSSEAAPAKGIETWSVAEVAAWLSDSQWPVFSQRIREEDIDGAALVLVTAAEFNALGFQLGPSKRLAQRVQELQSAEHNSDSSSVTTEACPNLMEIKQSLVSDRELADPTQLVARRLAGMIDFCMLVVVPIVYVISVSFALRGNQLFTLVSPEIQLTYVDLGSQS